MFLSIPGLRPADLHAGRLPNLQRLVADGESRELVPTFPCVTSPVQSTMWTGVGPDRHGVIANGFYHRDRREVELWIAFNQVHQAPQLWDAIARNDGLTSAVWHAQNIKDAAADFICTPAPIHDADGTTKPWCYSKPDGLYERLVADLGHFPLQHYWGPLSNIESSKWTVEAALWLHRHYAPNFHWVYLQHLDYAGQKVGPEGPEALAALQELDALIGHFVDAMRKLPGGDEVDWIVAGEYALTDVRGAVFPNRMLREAGLLRVNVESDGEHLDLAGSDAFAMVDHQVAHVYVTPEKVEAVAELFTAAPGIAVVAAGPERGVLGMDHERAGEVVLAGEHDRWFAYYWWLEDAAAPGFARTVDIHRKPGYDPVELFFDPSTRSIPIDASLVKGSHGAPADRPEQRTMMLSSLPGVLTETSDPMRDTEVHGVLSRALGL
jgi:predicted AlkP superfamily pyrophosphatase or phosphodiesterase